MAVTSGSHAPLRARTLVRSALATYRANIGRVAGAAFLVLVPLGLLETATEARVEVVDDPPGPVVLARILLAVIGGIGAALGSTLFAGLLDKLVGEHQHGHARLSLGEVVRTLPYGRLVIADALLIVVTGVGTLLLILPGLLAFTLFALVGPLINIEGHSVIGAFRRSARLVRPYLWTAFVVVTLPAFGEEVLDEGLHGLLHDLHPVVVAVVLNGVLAMSLGAIVGLIEVTLAYELVERNRAQGTAPHPSAPSPDGAGDGKNWVTTSE